jgi:hypothetical protein
LPGSERRRRRADRLSKGVPMLRELIEQLDALTGELSVERLEER